MNYFDAIVLGVLQGLTEFLPVSSSGHLVIAEALLGVTMPGVSVEVMLHLGTLLSVLVYFRERILRLIRSLWTASMTTERRLLLCLVIGTIPAGLAGVLLKDFFESAFDSPAMTSAMLIVTGAILLSTRLVKPGKKPLNPLTALLIGVGQSLAILPGISRSGSTIAVGMLAGVEPAEAAEFSFLLAIPAIGGASLLQATELAALPADLLAPIMAGTVCAFVTGLAAVYAVLATIRRGRFAWFAYYCFAAGAIGLYLFL